MMRLANDSPSCQPDRILAQPVLVYTRIGGAKASPVLLLFLRLLATGKRSFPRPTVRRLTPFPRAKAIADLHHVLTAAIFSYVVLPSIRFLGLPRLMMPLIAGIRASVAASLRLHCCRAAASLPPHPTANR
eukprot:766957-Hanusia_phi.AAC.1